MGAEASDGERDSAPSLTDAGNAERFVEMYGEDVRHVPEFGAFFIYNGQRFELDIDGAIMRLAITTARSFYADAAGASSAKEAAEFAKHAKHSESHRALTAMLQLVKAQPGITISQARLDSDPMLLGVPNGVVDLQRGELIAASRAQLVTKQTAVAFDPKAECPTWEKFLREIMGGSEELTEYLARFAGYSLTGRTDEQMLAFAYGTGANGKSTFLTTLRGLWADYARQSPAATLLASADDGGIRNDVARLRGARLVTCNEAEDGKRFAESLVKQVTGGDPIAARFLHREFFEFIPEFKIILAANHKPIIRGDDPGIWRRIHLIPFAVTIPPEKRDKTLLTRLRDEWPGILAWAVRGCLEWQASGLSPPEEVVAATRDYREEMDMIGAWLAEHCIVAPHARVQASAAYHDYSKWTDARGARPMSLMSFSRKLTERGFEKRKSSSVYFFGLGLQAASDSSATGDATPVAEVDVGAEAF